MRPTRRAAHIPQVFGRKPALEVASEHDPSLVQMCLRRSAHFSANDGRSVAVHIEDKGSQLQILSVLRPTPEHPAKDDRFPARCRSPSPGLVSDPGPRRCFSPLHT
jgi:hypothetical protein